MTFELLAPMLGTNPSRPRAGKRIVAECPRWAIDKELWSPDIVTVVVSLLSEGSEAVIVTRRIFGRSSA